jgi:hypothetical protein
MFGFLNETVYDGGTNLSKGTFMKAVISQFFILFALIGMTSSQFAVAKTQKHHKSSHKKGHAKTKGKKGKKKKARAHKAASDTGSQAAPQ